MQLVNKNSRASTKAMLRVALALIACAVVALSALAFAPAADAAPAAGEDQYLEQVPNGGGTTGGNDPSNTQDFSQSVGSDTNAVTAEDVKAEAKKHKKKNSGSADSSAKTIVADQVTTPPAATESVATAAKLGPFSRSTTLALLALIIAAGAGSVVVRKHNAAPRTDL